MMQLSEQGDYRPNASPFCAARAAIVMRPRLLANDLHSPPGPKQKYLRETASAAHPAGMPRCATILFAAALLILSASSGTQASREEQSDDANR